MTTPKTLLCRCEDVTVDECRDAIAHGYEAFEDLKRYLGVGTGPCQGKACVQACMRLIADERGIPVDEVDVMTFRPPVRPVPFATLAADDATINPPTPPTPPNSLMGFGRSASPARPADGPGAKRA